MSHNLRAIIARRAAEGAVTLAVYAGAALAFVLLAGRERAARATGGSTILGLAVLVALAAAALWAESELIGQTWPALMARRP